MIEGYRATTILAHRKTGAYVNGSPLRMHLSFLVGTHSDESLQEVIVTAQKPEEGLLDTVISIIKKLQASPGTAEPDTSPHRYDAPTHPTFGRLGAVANQLRRVELADAAGCLASCAMMRRDARERRRRRQLLRGRLGYP